MSEMTLQNDPGHEWQKVRGLCYLPLLPKPIFAPRGPVFCPETFPFPLNCMWTFKSWIFLGTVGQNMLGPLIHFSHYLWLQNLGEKRSLHSNRTQLGGYSKAPAAWMGKPANQCLSKGPTFLYVTCLQTFTLWGYKAFWRLRYRMQIDLNVHLGFFILMKTGDFTVGE